MKIRILSVFLMITASAAVAQSGYDINITLRPFSSGWLYLGHHFGNKQYIIDSARLNSNCEAHFSGRVRLQGGVYLVVFPKKNGWFEILVDRQQHFSVMADTSDLLGKMQFTNSFDNQQFKAYQRYIQDKGKTITQLQNQLKEAKSKSDSAVINAQLANYNKEIQTYRTNFMKANPNSLLTAIFKVLQEPRVPPAEQQPGGRYDSVFAFQYYKQHYWDGVSFTDERLVRTPVLEPKLQRYFDHVVPQHPDSLIREANRILDAASSNKETFKYYLSTLTDKYVNPTYMGQDAVFVNLFEKYYAQGKADYFMSEKYHKFIFDRAYSLMANLIGEKAANIELTDTAGRSVPLYSVTGNYIVICFWDPTCSHCQVEVPKLDSIFQNKWKEEGVRLYGVMVDGGKDNWLKFIREHNLKDWIHVYQTQAARDSEYAAGKPSYKQLFDVYQTPMLYLLDANKNIIAKKLNYEQLDDFLQVKMKNGKSTK